VQGENFGEVEAGMNSICEVFARITHAPQVFIYSKSKASKNLKVQCQFGFPATELSEDWHMKAFDNSSSKAISYTDTEVSSELQSHPMLRAVPKIKSLLAFSIAQEAPGEPSFLMIANPMANVFTDSNLMTALLQMATMTRHTFCLPPARVPEASNVIVESSFAESHQHTQSGQDQVAASFLLKTLVVGQRLLTRNGFSYVALRSWREPIKEHQMAAMKAVKANLPDSFMATIASEIAQATVSQLGIGVVGNVVPVPCADSGCVDGLSVGLAERVAVLLGCGFRDVFGSEMRRGSSRPPANVKLVGDLDRATLLIDGVVTSGKRVEAAMKCLRQSGVNCFAVGWIAS
jgi:hypothetical protein